MIEPVFNCIQWIFQFNIPLLNEVKTTPRMACDSYWAAATITKPAAEKTHVNTIRKLHACEKTGGKSVIKQREKELNGFSSTQFKLNWTYLIYMGRNGAISLTSNDGIVSAAAHDETRMIENVRYHEKIYNVHCIYVT